VPQALAFAATPVEAQGRGGGGRGGGGRGGYYGGGYGGGYGGYGRGYGGYGYGGRGGYGYGGWGGYGYPGFYGYDSGYYPDYYSGNAPMTGDYQRFYPPDAATLSSAPSNNTAVIRVRTVPGAELWFDDTATTQSGPVRTFTTPELQPGKEFEYHVKVRWMDNGKPVERTKTVDLSPGRVVDVDLTPSSMK